MCLQNGTKKGEVGLEYHSGDCGFDLGVVGIRLVCSGCILEAWLRIWWRLHHGGVRPRQNDQRGPQQSSDEWW